MVGSGTYFAFIFKLVETPGCVCVGGYSDIFIHTYGLDHFFGFVIQYFKMNNFEGMKIMRIFLGDHYVVVPGLDQ